MIELNATLAVLMVEALICLVVLAVGYFFVKGNKKNKELTAADKMIKTIKKSTQGRTESLAGLVDEYCSIEPELQQQLLEEINRQERTLYQQIIRLFLDKDAAVLNKIESCIRGLSEPYCKMLEFGTGSATETSNAQQEIKQLHQNNKRLSEQLHNSLKAMDEISSEYTRMFKGTKNEIELQTSFKKMLQTCHDAELRVKASTVQQDTSES
jgi:hypothetical protein